jgi:Fe-S-cluster-containing dehydrogenase component
MSDGTQPLVVDPAPEDGMRTPPDPPAAEPAGTQGIELSFEIPAISRRQFLVGGLAAGVGMACGVGVLRVLGVQPLASDGSPAVAGSPQWAFVVDTRACIGCGLCVAACKEENEVPLEVAYARTWVERHTVLTDGSVRVDAPDGGINGFPQGVEGVSKTRLADSFFEPRLCMQCLESPCTVVCPVGATYRTEDGVILVDSERCIGCGYCVVACPYGARYIVPDGERLPGGRPGVADKCTWCYHRITRGESPACVEVCPTGARAFGDLSDPTSPMHDRVDGAVPLHPEYGTKPVVLYRGPIVDGTERS